MTHAPLKSRLTTLFAILISIALAFGMIPAIAFATPDDAAGTQSEQAADGLDAAAVNDLPASPADGDEATSDAADTSADDADVLAADSEAEEPADDQGSEVAVLEDEEAEASELTMMAGASVTYRTHVQTYGWQSWVSDGSLAGTTGESKRVEALQIKLKNAPYSGSIKYSAHVQGIGWMDPVTDGATAGTTGQSRRVEAITIELTGEMAEKYDVYYRVHSQKLGWMGWAKNGEKAGSKGCYLRVEALQVKLVEKGGAAPGSTVGAYRQLALSYRAHVQRIGWQNWVGQKATCGTTGEGLRMEAIKVSLNNTAFDGQVRYRAHVQTYGWQDWVDEGEIAGTTGEGKRVEAIQMELTGTMADRFDIYYRVHVQKYGWLGWAKNGEKAGTAKCSYRMEAMEVALVQKGGDAPGTTINAYTETPKDSVYLRGIDISSWQGDIDLDKISCDFVIIKVSQNTNYINPYWRQWAKKALASGKQIGLYHYATSDNYKAEADYFLNEVRAGGYLGKAVLIYDWEPGSNPAYKAASSTPKNWCDYVKKQTGATPWIYVMQSIMSNYTSSGYPLWIAQYARDYEDNGTNWQDHPWNEGAYNCVCRQYTSNGRISGYSGPLDLDKFYGPVSLWQQYTKIK